MDVSWVPIEELHNEGREVEVSSDLGIDIKMSEKVETRVVKTYSWTCPKCDHIEKARSEAPKDSLTSYCWHCRHVIEKVRDEKRAVKRRELIIEKKFEIAKKEQRLFSELDLSNVELILSLEDSDEPYNIDDVKIVLLNGIELKLYSSEGSMCISWGKIDYVNEYSLNHVYLSKEVMAEIDKQVREIQ